MLNLFKDFLGYFKYHLFEVKIQSELSFEYKIWVIKRFFHVLLFGKRKSISYLFPKDVVISNQFGNFFVPKNSDMILTLSSKSEADLLQFFHIKPNTIFLDIGGNAGKYSSYIAKNYSPKKICTFEPSPSTFAVLQKNVSLNPSPFISIYNLGISDLDSKIKFANGDNISGLSHFIDDHDIIPEGFSIVDVKVISLDKFMLSQNIDPLDIDLIKIDVEGHEMKVLMGATQLLRSVPAGTRILIEIFPDLIKVNNILKFIESYHFKVMKINMEYYLFTKNNYL